MTDQHNHRDGNSGFSATALLVDAEPAVMAREACTAWAALPGRRAAPASVTPEQVREGSVVYRLRGVGAHGSDVIAKWIRGSSLERTVYQDVLPRLAAQTPRYLGCQEQDAAVWIFLEDAGGSRYDWTNPGHRAAAGRWLGELHRCALSVDVVRTLPRRDIWYWAELRSEVRHFVSELGRRARTPEATDAAAGIGASCDEVRSGWHAVERICESIPPTLVHGDLVSKNIRVRQEGDGVEVLPLDWGSAGHGAVAIDLAYVDPGAYWEAVHPHLPGLALEDAVRLSSLGRLFRTLLLIRWLHDEDGADLSAASIAKLEFYDRWLHAELPTLRTVA